MAKIVHVVEAFGGGVFYVLAQLANALAKEGHQVVVLYSGRPETPKSLGDFFVEGVFLKELHMVRSVNPLRDVHSLAQLIKQFRHHQPDVIHLHSSKAGFLGRVAARFCGMASRTCYSPHGLAFLRQDVPSMARWMYREIERIGHWFGGTIVACSESERRHVRTSVGDRAVKLVENAVEISQIPIHAGRTRGDCRVGTVGRISPQKNPKLFLDVMKEIGSSGLFWHWVGGGTFEDERVLREAGVNVSGWLPREQALNMMSDLDIMIQTSAWEGMPLTLIEAQVAGIPAIVTDVVGNRDVVEHGITGYVGRSQRELVEAIQDLVVDQARRHEMGKSARAAALRRFSTERMLAAWLKVYGLPRPRGTDDLGKPECHQDEIAS